ncbi:MAG: ATP synthase F1 subunit epsilon [Deltaproteobacteria bacterium]|nr:ATP synthase F1 subunit epsilon [Deltaproteobacteria bacterium]MBZ0220031.1 ATP synthase F1 subunit epsilon [Deltaproteobacteria bacterium]
MADNNTTFLLEIVTPQRKLLSMEVEEATAPGQEGEFGVLAGHTPFLTVLKPGEVAFRKGAEAGVLAVGRGYAEVLPGKTTILVDTAARESEIDLEAVRAEAGEAQAALGSLSQEDAAYAQAQDRLEYAEARLRIKERVRA